LLLGSTKGRHIAIVGPVSPAYEAEMDRLGLHPGTISRVDGYMRASSGGSSTQTMKITVELGAPKNTVNVRSHHDDYLVVLGYAQTPKVDEIRHAYLHVRLNNYAAAAAFKVPGRSNLMALLNAARRCSARVLSTFEYVHGVSFALSTSPGSGASAAAEKREQLSISLLLMPYFLRILADLRSW
jgi:hypothetical protein